MNRVVLHCLVDVLSRRMWILSTSCRLPCTSTRALPSTTRSKSRTGFVLLLRPRHCTHVRKRTNLKMRKTFPLCLINRRAYSRPQRLLPCPLSRWGWLFRTISTPITQKYVIHLICPCSVLGALNRPRLPGPLNQRPKCAPPALVVMIIVRCPSNAPRLVAIPRSRKSRQTF